MSTSTKKSSSTAPKNDNYEEEYEDYKYSEYDDSYHIGKGGGGERGGGGGGSKNIYSSKHSRIRAAAVEKQCGKKKK